MRCRRRKSRLQHLAQRPCAYMPGSPQSIQRRAAVAVMGNCDRRGETSLIVVAHVASAANTANEIAADVATPWTFYLGSPSPARGWATRSSPPIYCTRSLRSHSAAIGWHEGLFICPWRTLGTAARLRNRTSDKWLKCTVGSLV